MWYVAALGLTLSAFAMLLYLWLGHTLYQHHDHELLDDAERVSGVLAGVPLDEPSIDHALASLYGAPRLLMIRNSVGELVYRSPVLRVAEPTIGQHEALIHAAAHAPRDPEFFTVTLERSGLVRFICTPMRRAPAAYVQVGSELGDVPTTLRAVAVASIALVPIVLVLTSFGGWFIAKRALAPIQSVASTLQAIEATDLSRRVEVHPADGELTSLVGTINGLLQRLDRAFRDLRDFTADVSHQLQTPLTILKATTELARRANPGDPYLDDIESSVDDLSGTVSGLQSLSLADAEAQRTRQTAVDLSGLCEDAADILEALAEGKDVRLDRTIEPNVVVSGDSAQMKQMILNVGDNAIKYTPGGGRVWLRLTQDGEIARIEVADTGAGIPPDQLLRIFDRFFRGAEGASASRGSGLGLAIARRIAEIHHGSIDCSSEVGKGTRFTLRLPLVKDEHVVPRTDTAKSDA